MPIAKLGSTSHIEINEVAAKHFDLDRQIGEHICLLDLSTKEKLVSRLPSLIEMIKQEQDQQTKEV